MITRCWALVNAARLVSADARKPLQHLSSGAPWQIVPQHCRQTGAVGWLRAQGVACATGYIKRVEHKMALLIGPGLTWYILHN